MFLCLFFCKKKGGGKKKVSFILDSLKDLTLKRLGGGAF